MQISDLSSRLQLKLGLGANRDHFLSSLRPGQILQAVAVSPNVRGRLRLRIGNNDVVAQTGLQATVGQKLSLAVVKTGVLPELTLIQARSNEDLQALALKSALPRQVPLDLMLSNLFRFRNQPVIAQSPEIRDTVRRLLEGIPAPSDLKSGQQLAQLWRESGLFMEPRLMRGGAQSADLKANLLRLLVQLQNIATTTVERAPAGQPAPAASLRSAGRAEAPHTSPEQSNVSFKPTVQKAAAGQPAYPGTAQSAVRPEAHQTTPAQAQSVLLRELASQTEGALARIQLNQLASLPAGEREPQVWQLDLPLRYDDQTEVFQLRIEKDASSAEQATTPGWTLTLRFDLQPLGPIEVRLSLSGDAITTHFWAEKEDTRTRIEKQLPHLERAFVRVGLSAARFKVHQGMPPEPPPLKRCSPLLDVKA